MKDPMAPVVTAIISMVPSTRALLPEAINCTVCMDPSSTTICDVSIPTVAEDAEADRFKRAGPRTNMPPP